MKNYSFSPSLGRLLTLASLFAVFTTVFLVGCKKGDKTDSSSDAITFSPEKIERGKLLTVNGRNFDSNTKVILNGKELSISSVAPTKLEVTIPGNALDGKIIVKNGADEKQSATALHIFNYFIQTDDQAPPFHSLGAFSTMIYNDRVYFALGEVYRDGTWWQNKIVYAYDPIVKKWNAEFTLPENKITYRRTPFMLVKDNKWYVGGGNRGGSGLKDFWVMDLSKTGEEAWTELEPLPVETFNDDAFELNNKVYVANLVYGRKLYELELPAAANDNKGKWSAVTDLYLGTNNYGYFAIDNKAYFSSNGVLGIVDFTKTGTQMLSAVLMENISVTKMFAHDNKGYCIGVEDGTSNLYSLDTANNKWTKRMEMTGFNGGETFAVVKDRLFMIYMDGKVYEYIAK